MKTMTRVEHAEPAVPPTIPERPGKAADPCVMVVFGGTGDLNKRKLIPALYNLATSNLLAPEFAVIGIGRTAMTSEEFRRKIDQDMRQFATVPVEPAGWQPLLSRIYYLVGDAQDKDTYVRLRELLEEVDKNDRTRGNYLYYLATAPEFFGEVVRQLGAA
ncbi:MAG TPA: glucose-6-phosphate dehydrogenase, partial [Candidatus Binatia bacterium]|nr:glucose-6-phosphate dehydrogenase [Candidatus Binatia bacterium]